MYDLFYHTSDIIPNKHTNSIIKDIICLQELTGMFKFNPLQAPKLTSTLKTGVEKENVTPPEPQLLSQVKNGNKDSKGSKADLFISELPPSPKLLGNYSFLNK